MASAKKNATDENKYKNKGIVLQLCETQMLYLWEEKNITTYFIF